MHTNDSFRFVKIRAIRDKSRNGSIGTGRQTMEQMLATCGAAYAAADAAGNAWTIGNAVIRKTLAWRDDVGLCLAALEHRTTGYVWRPPLPEDDWAGGEFALRWNDAVLSARQATALRGVRAQADAASVTLFIDLRMADALDITLCLRARSDTAVIEQWLVVTARQPGVLSRVASLTVSVAGLACAGAALGARAAGPRAQGCRMPALTLPSRCATNRWAPSASSPACAPPGTRSPGLRSTATRPTGTSGEGLFAGLLYSGRWSAARGSSKSTAAQLSGP
jgi:hypothetical protein